MPDTSPDPARIATWQAHGYYTAQTEALGLGASLAELQASQSAFARGLAGERPALSLAELPDAILAIVWRWYVMEDISDDAMQLHGVVRSCREDIAEGIGGWDAEMVATVARFRAALATPPSGDGGTGA